MYWGKVVTEVQFGTPGHSAMRSPQSRGGRAGAEATVLLTRPWSIVDPFGDKLSSRLFVQHLGLMLKSLGSQAFLMSTGQKGISLYLLKLRGDRSAAI